MHNEKEVSKNLDCAHTSTALKLWNYTYDVKIIWQTSYTWERYVILKMNIISKNQPCFHKQQQNNRNSRGTLRYKIEKKKLSNSESIQKVKWDCELANILRSSKVNKITEPWLLQSLQKTRARSYSFQNESCQSGWMRKLALCIYVHFECCPMKAVCKGQRYKRGKMN